MEIESLEHNPVPEWVAGMVGVLSGLLVLLVIFLTTNTAEPTKEEAANQRSFRAGLLRSLFGGRLALAVVASFVLWLLLTLAIMVPFFWFSPEAPPKPGLNLTASINFCEGPDFVHSELLAEPVNVVTSFLFYLPVGLVGLLGPKEGRRELRFALSYGSIGLIGFGSGALHASLDAVAQAGDELPMLQLLCCASVVWIPSSPRKACSKLPPGCLG
ncbi:unnamed protein product [Effrenium voratum]|uniref:Uncharacterized protein n=1 Tax=Effrenium voratum TaxID=2562239 RepID=A0AA36HM44_9DINO|nr:unnamed protein product [Effrenium voratum]